MSKRYLLRDREHNLIETPQYFWMRVAMGLALTEKIQQKLLFASTPKCQPWNILPVDQQILLPGLIYQDFPTVT